MQETKTPIQSYTQYQLRKRYGVSYKTWIKWLEPIQAQLGELKGKCYTPKQVKIIFDHLGEP